MGLDYICKHTPFLKMNYFDVHACLQSYTRYQNQNIKRKISEKAKIVQ